MFAAFLRDIKNLSPVVLSDPSLQQLTAIERVVLACDATLTEILEAYAGEKIVVHKLKEQVLQLNDNIPHLHSSDQIVFRETLLIGSKSAKVMIYARSLIDLGLLLNKGFKQDLISTSIPLGHLFKSYKIETFRELLGYKEEDDDELLSHFGVAAGKFISRTNVVYSYGKPLMLITEKVLKNYL